MSKSVCQIILALSLSFHAHGTSIFTDAFLHPDYVRYGPVIVWDAFNNNSAFSHTDYTFRRDFKAFNPNPEHYVLLSSVMTETNRLVTERGGGQGYMMVIDGAMNSSRAIWRRTLRVEAGMQYRVVFHAASTSRNGNPPYADFGKSVFAIFIDGEQVGEPLVLEQDPGIWMEFARGWLAERSADIEIEIRALTTNYWGNDFVFDDVLVRAIRRSKHEVLRESFDEFSPVDATDYAFRPTSQVFNPGPGGYTLLGQVETELDRQVTERGGGDGYMMVLDGSTVPNVAIWKKPILLPGPALHEFSFWAASTAKNNNPSGQDFGAPQFGLFLDGKQLGETLTLDSPVATWSKYTIRWTSESPSGHTLELRGLTTQYWGNDFVIDDILLVTTPYQD